MAAYLSSNGRGWKGHRLWRSGSIGRAPVRWTVPWQRPPGCQLPLSAPRLVYEAMLPSVASTSLAVSAL